MDFFNKLTRDYFWKKMDIFRTDQHDQHQATGIKRNMMLFFNFLFKAKSEVTTEETD